MTLLEFSSSPSWAALAYVFLTLREQRVIFSPAAGWEDTSTAKSHPAAQLEIN